MRDVTVGNMVASKGHGQMKRTTNRQSFSRTTKSQHGVPPTVAWWPNKERATNHGGLDNGQLTHEGTNLFYPTASHPCCDNNQAGAAMIARELWINALT